MLRLVLAVGWLLQPFAARHLARRSARGKEDPARWREKLGETAALRPDGPLVWLHGVGLGEVMALRGLIDALSASRPDLSFLVTSSARSSADVFARNLPPRTRHQYLPLDLPGPVTMFLDHWKPDLAVWSDQEVWPRLAVHIARRGVPQAYIAARITDASAQGRARFGQAYGDLYRLLDTRHAQDATTAAHLRSFMGGDTPVPVTGSLKAAAAPLADDPGTRFRFETAIAGRPVWLLASAHTADVAIALEAHAALRATVPNALLIIAPRQPDSAPAISHAAAARSLPTCQRSAGALPDGATAVYVADTLGELGLWYRSASIALIGGTFSDIEGHNPWEAAALGCAILHGPRTANFAQDYQILRDASAALLVTNAAEIATALSGNGLPAMVQRATRVREQAARHFGTLIDELLALLDR